MHQPILVHADVDERAEGRHVGHHAFQHHAGLQVLDVFHAVLEGGGLEFRARIAAGLLEFAQDVDHGRQAELVVGELQRGQAAQRLAVAEHVADAFLDALENALHHRIRFRVHRGAVERVVAVVDAQEAGGLLEGLVAQARHLPEGFAVGEHAVGVAVFDDVLGQDRVEPRHARQQRGRGCVDVDADRVHAVLDHGVQRAGQLALVDVVLVLAHADRLRVDLHELGQRVLQAAGDRHRAAQRHVQVGEFLGRQLGGRIYRCAGLAHHDLGQLHFGC